MVSAVLVAVAPVEAPADAVITKSNADDVDGPKTAGSAGANTAVSERDPTANVDVVPDAVPLLTATGLPRLVVPSLNCTVPVAVAGVIVAVSVTGVPWATGDAGDVASSVPVATAPVAAVATKVTGGDVDGLKAAGSIGVNTAVNWCDPAAKEDVVPDAVPLLTATGIPRFVTPSLNCTAPTAVAGVTVAVSVTGVPSATGEAGDVASAVLVAGAPVTTNIAAGDVDGP